MSRVEFDELLRQKMDSEELEVDPVHWDRLAALLPTTTTLPATPAKSRRLLPWVTGIAASVAALVAVAWFFTGEKDNHADRPVLSEKSEPAHRPETPVATKDTTAAQQNRA